jgi:predicted TIM-barrel enzyme
LKGLTLAQIPRSELLTRFRQKIVDKQPIVGAGAGTGLSAKCEEAGGADLIIIYNSGRFRMAGRGSLSGLLAYGNANDLVIEMGREVLPIVQNVPVLAGVNGTDPFLDGAGMMRTLLGMEFSGVQNFPTVGLIDGVFRANLEETGMSYALEVDMIARAHDHDLLTTPYVFSAEDAVAMTNAGADIVVCHMGLTTGGTIGADTARGLDDCVVLATEWAAAARSIRDDVIVLVHGGPIADPEDAQYVLSSASGIHGFYGASSMERLPTETAITERVREFTSLTL